MLPRECRQSKGADSHTQRRSLNLRSQRTRTTTLCVSPLVFTMTDDPAAVSPPSADDVEAAALGALTSRLATAVALLASSSPFSSRGLWPHPAGAASPHGLLLLLLLLRRLPDVATSITRSRMSRSRRLRVGASGAVSNIPGRAPYTGPYLQQIIFNLLTHASVVSFSAGPGADAWQDVHVRVTAEPLGPPGVPRAFRVSLKAEPGRGLPSEAAVAAFVSSVFSGGGAVACLRSPGPPTQASCFELSTAVAGRASQSLTRRLHKGRPCDRAHGGKGESLVPPYIRGSVSLFH